MASATRHASSSPDRSTKGSHKQTHQLTTRSEARRLHCATASTMPARSIKRTPSIILSRERLTCQIIPPCLFSPRSDPTLEANPVRLRHSAPRNAAAGRQPNPHRVKRAAHLTGGPFRNVTYVSPPLPILLLPYTLRKVATGLWSLYLTLSKITEFVSDAANCSDNKI